MGPIATKNTHSFLWNAKGNANLSVIEKVHKSGGDTDAALKRMQITGPEQDDFVAIYEKKCRRPEKVSQKLEKQIRMQYKR